MFSKIQAKVVLRLIHPISALLVLLALGAWVSGFILAVLVGPFAAATYLALFLAVSVWAWSDRNIDMDELRHTTFFEGLCRADRCKLRWVLSRVFGSGKLRTKVYVVDDSRIEPFASGFGKNQAIVLSRETVSFLNKWELVALFAHEHAHLRHASIRYLFWASIPIYATNIGAAVILVGGIFGAVEPGFWVAGAVWRVASGVVSWLGTAKLRQVHEYAADCYAIRVIDPYFLAVMDLKIRTLLAMVTSRKKPGGEARRPDPPKSRLGRLIRRLNHNHRVNRIRWSLGMCD